MDKIRIHPLLDEIQKEFNNYPKVLAPYEVAVNAHSKIKYILAYINVLMCYGEEIAFLYNHSWNTSIEPLTRDFLECYEVIGKLNDLYDTADFDDYVRYLYYLDISQTFAIIDSYKNDATVSGADAQKNIDNYVNDLKFVIKDIFIEYITDINDSDLESSIRNIYKKIKSIYCKGKYDYAKTQKIGEALFNNAAILADSGKPYERSYTVYKILCHSTHNNISSIHSRSINNGVIMMNTETENVLPSLSLVYYCMKDVNTKIEQLLRSI